ncbi:MAG: L,D-transpeptidase family protein [Methylocella sp.]
MASTFLVGAFGAACLLAQVGTGQAQLLPGSDPVTAKSQPTDAAAGGAPLDSGASNDLGCASPLAEGSRAKVFVPPERPRSDRRRKGKPDRAHEGGTALLDDPTPTLQLDTAFCTRKAAERYRRIADDGGWAMIPKALGRDASAKDVERLRQRLSVEGDLPQEGGSGDAWDDSLADAVTRFQRRAGLQQSGEVDEATLHELNVPADVRARELEASAKRIADVKIDFNQRYVVVNIPSASVEAVQDLRVAQRHAAVAGELDHQSPQLIAAIRSITINPAWTIPRSIVESEVIPKLKKNPQYLRRAKLAVLDRKGHKINARRIHWSDAAASLAFRQEPGSKNPLGTLRIDMPNRQEVYLHDTPSKQTFAADYRFLSHGCVRVDGIYDLATWLLNANSNGHWDRDAIVDAVREGSQKRIDLARAVPVAWIYLDAWASADGTVHYRPDVYGLDGAGGGHQTRR